MEYFIAVKSKYSRKNNNIPFLFYKVFGRSEAISSEKANAETVIIE